MNISLGYKGLYSKYMDTKKPGEVSKNTDSEEFLEDKASSLSMNYYNGYWMKAAKADYDELENDAKKKAKQANLSFKDMSDEEKAAQLYYTLRYNKILNFSIDQLAGKINIGDNIYNGLAFPLFCTMKAAGLDPAIMVSNRRTGIRMSELMDVADLTTATYLPGVNKFLSFQSIYDVPFTTPYEIEGLTNTKSFKFDHPGAIMSTKKMTGLTNIEAGPKVSASTSDKNSRIENLKMALTPEKNSLAVRRSTTLSGYYKADTQKDLILYED